MSDRPRSSGDLSAIRLRVGTLASVVVLATGCASVDSGVGSGDRTSEATQATSAGESVSVLPAPVRAVVDAINNGDTEAFVAAFTPDGVIDDWGRVLRGAEGIASWAATDAIGQKATITVTSAVTSGHVTEIQFDWRSNRFNGQSHAFVTVAGDKVSEFRIPSPQ